MASSGCGDPGYGDVQGRVTFGGKMLLTGLVVFTNEDDTRLSFGYLKADGTCEIWQATTSRSRVVVTTAEFKDMIDERAAKAFR